MKYQKKDPHTILKTLSPDQYVVTQKKATESPFQNEYYNEYRKGL
jgi:peptide methionine sulfoxide reductase msrA/msrB